MGYSPWSGKELDMTESKGNIMEFEMSRPRESALYGLWTSAMPPGPQHELLCGQFLDLPEPQVFKSVK